MRSSFFEFNVAISGLTVARGGLDVTSHNVANAASDGYSRQVVEQRASRPISLYNGRGMIGTGAEIYGVTQIRSFYLDKKYWSEVPVLGEYSVKKAQLSLTESYFNEMSGTGLSGQFKDFFNRLEDLTTNPHDPTYRTNVIQLGGSMSTFFKNTYEALSKQQKDINGEVKSMVGIINSLGKQIVALNQQITRFELDGSFANDLRDQRALIVDKLSQYVNVEVKEVEMNEGYEKGLYPNPEERSLSQKRYIVSINGYDFVNHYDVSLMECRERSTKDGNKSIGLYSNPEDAAGLYDIYFTKSNVKFDIYSSHLTGELKGLIDLRDGNNGNYVHNMGFNSFNATTNQLVMNIDLASERVDLNPGGGVLSVYDRTTGTKMDYEYSSYSYNIATGEATFQLINVPAGTTAASFDTPKSATTGKTTDYKGIPYYMSRLNNLVRTFAKAINEGKLMNGSKIPEVIGHIDGRDLTGVEKDTLFFTYKETDSTYANFGQEVIFDGNFNIYKFTADNFFINDELVKNPRLLAAAVEGTSESNNDVIKSFLKIFHSKTLFREGSIEDYIIGMTGELGIDLDQANQFETNYKDVTTVIQNQRLSVSGVSINEEMTAMIKYQQLFTAASKLVNTINDIYDRLINGLGV